MIFQRRYRIWVLCVVVPLVGCAWDRDVKVAELDSGLQTQGKLPTAKLHVEMARMLGRSGEQGGAEIHYREALKLSPQSLEAQLVQRDLAKIARAADPSPGSASGAGSMDQSRCSTSHTAC